MIQSIVTFASSLLIVVFIFVPIAYIVEKWISDYVNWLEDDNNE